MIYDRLENAYLYRNLHARLARAFDFLLTTDLTQLPSGKQTIDGDCVFALVNDYSTQPYDECRFEAHRRYTDIQYMVSGIEQIGVIHVGSLKTTESYIAERDIAFFAGQGDRMTLSEGTFAVFFPHDAHQPGIAVGQPQQVRKVVMKVALSD